jgi:hypothetical protein
LRKSTTLGNPLGRNRRHEARGIRPGGTALKRHSGYQSIEKTAVQKEEHMKEKIGAVRIVRADKHNYSVQKFEAPDPNHPKTKSTEPRWVDKHFVGHRLEWAAAYALKESASEGQEITREFVENAISAIVKQTKATVGECVHE